MPTRDTKVLLQGLTGRDEEFLTQMNGIFAFALYDRRKRILLLARDPTVTTSAIRDVLPNAPGARARGENGLRLVRERFQWDSIGRQTDAMLKSLLPAND
jgi:hypothetical protein